MGEGRTHCIVWKTSEKNKFHNRNKPSVVFNGMISMVYENDIFPTFPCGTVEIHDMN